MHYPFMSQAERDAQDRDDARFHPDPEAGRHRPECCCSRCDPYDEPEPLSAEQVASRDVARTDPATGDDEPPF
ncbi:hypothetical protein ACWELJ_25870 [Nocardia sp. NPDC004582]